MDQAARPHVLLETVALGAHEDQELLALGVSLKTAIQHGVSSKSYWHMSQNSGDAAGLIQRVVEGAGFAQC